MRGLDPALNLRVPSLDDAAAVAQITNLTAVTWSGEPLTDANEVRADWSDPDRDLAATTRVVETADGAIVGALQVFARPPNTEILTVVERHPDYGGLAIEETLLELGGGIAAALGEDAPAACGACRCTWTRTA